MPKVVLEKILEWFDFMPEDTAAYCDPESGNVYVISDEEWDLLESAEPPDSDTPEWQQQILAELQKLDREKLIRLPDKLDVQEWEIMERFGLSLSNSHDRDTILDAIHGSGAFRLFRREIEMLGLQENWYAFRRAALEEIARDWAEQNGLTPVA